MKSGLRESGTANVNGAELYYEVEGTGHPLVLLHGHLVDCRMWDDQISALAQHYQVIRYDARGWGRSPASPGPYAHEADLYEFLRLLEVEQAALMGLSGGGTIAIDFALTYPSMVSALITVGSGVTGFQWPEFADPREIEMMAAFEQGNLDLAVELSLQVWTDGVNRTPEQTDLNVRARVREMTRHWLAVRNDEAIPIPLEPPAISRLSDIGVPTLIIVGALDLPPIHQIADVLAAQIVGAEKVILPDTAHHLCMEQPRQFNELVLGFLRKNLENYVALYPKHT